LAATEFTILTKEKVLIFIPTVVNIEEDGHPVDNRSDSRSTLEDFEQGVGENLAGD
jgi:hypothetical protein